MDRGVKIITDAGRSSCPDNLIPKFLGLGVQNFHSSVSRLLQRRVLADHGPGRQRGEVTRRVISAPRGGG